MSVSAKSKRIYKIQYDGLIVTVRRGGLGQWRWSRTWVKAGRDILSLPAQNPCPASPPLSRSTPSDSNYYSVILYFINTFWLCTNGHVRTSRVTNALVPLLKNRDINFCHMHATILLKVFLSVRPSFLPLVHHAVEISANYPWPPTRDWCCQAYGLVLINSF